MLEYSCQILPLLKNDHHMVGNTLPRQADGRSYALQQTSTNVSPRLRWSYSLPPLPMPYLMKFDAFITPLQANVQLLHATLSDQLLV